MTPPPTKLTSVDATIDSRVEDAAGSRIDARSPFPTFAELVARARTGAAAEPSHSHEAPLVPIAFSEVEDDFASHVESLVEQSTGYSAVVEEAARPLLPAVDYSPAIEPAFEPVEPVRREIARPVAAAEAPREAATSIAAVAHVAPAPGSAHELRVISQLTVRDTAREVLRARLLLMGQARSQRSAQEVVFIMLAFAVMVLVSAPPLVRLAHALHGTPVA